MPPRKNEPKLSDQLSAELTGFGSTNIDSLPEVDKPSTANASTGNGGPDLDADDADGQDNDQSPEDARIAALERQIAEMRELLKSQAAGSAPATTMQITSVPADQYRAAEFARVQAEALEIGTSESKIKGGCFFEGGEWVNAWGDIIDPETGKIKVQRHVPIDGRKIALDLEANNRDDS